MCSSRLPLPAPLRSTPITALRGYYERSDSCAGGSSALPSMNTVLTPDRSPSVTHASLVTIPSPTTAWPHLVALTRYPSAQGADGLLPSRTSPFPSRLVEYTQPNRVRLLRTSPPPLVAPHPASRRRSSHWIQAGERMPGEDLHLSGCVRLEAHPGGASRRIAGEGA